MRESEYHLPGARAPTYRVRFSVRTNQACERAPAPDLIEILVRVVTLYTAMVLGYTYDQDQG